MRDEPGRVFRLRSVGFEVGVDPACRVPPYLPYLEEPLACCIVHRVLHHGCRNCHFCDPSVMEEFLAAVKEVFGKEETHVDECT